MALFSKGKRVFLIGIGGAGMTALAQLLNDMGLYVEGSDIYFGDSVNRLLEMGITIHTGHKKEHLKGFDICVYSSAIFDNNEELIYAKENMPALSRGEAIGLLSEDYKRVVGISGTHGKTTVTAMIAHTLETSKKAHSALIGGRLSEKGRNGYYNKNEILICEACEFKRNFLQMKRDIAVILNIDNDHLEYYKTFDNLKKAFNDFAKSSEKCFAFSGDENAEQSGQSTENNVIFGCKDSDDYQARNIVCTGHGFDFDIYRKGGKLTSLHINLAGIFNVYNALACFCVCRELGCTVHETKAGIESFNGACRRFEILYNCDGITVADDYAHHPREIHETLKGIKECNYKRIIVVFQPFTYSRTAMFLNEFKEALKPADRVFITDIMGSREQNTFNIHSSRLCEITENADYCESFEDAVKKVISEARKGDIIITMGCGNIYKVAQELSCRLKKSK